MPITASRVDGTLSTPTLGVNRLGVFPFTPYSPEQDGVGSFDTRASLTDRSGGVVRLRGEGSSRVGTVRVEMGQGL